MVGFVRLSYKFKIQSILSLRWVLRYVKKIIDKITVCFKVRFDLICFLNCHFSVSCTDAIVNDNLSSSVGISDFIGPLAQ